MIRDASMDKVTREDLKGFPHKTADIILQQQKRGWRGYLQSNGHMSFLAPDGETRLTVSRNPNSAWYLTEELTKYYRKKPAVSKEKKIMDTKIACPRPGCNRTYNSIDKLNIHMEVDHDGMLKCPDCDKLFTQPRFVGLHRSAKHGYISPKRARRLAQEAARETVSKQTPQDPAQKPELQQGETPSHLVLDERDSWSVDLDKFQDITVQQLQAMYQSSGLGMEIRIWRISA